MLDPNFLEALKTTAETAKLSAEACLRIAEQLERDRRKNQWLPPEEVAELLGGGITAGILKDRCSNGQFTYGTEYINTSDGRRGNYLLKASAVEQFFVKHPSKRPPAKN